MTLFGQSLVNFEAFHIYIVYIYIYIYTIYDIRNIELYIYDIHNVGYIYSLNRRHSTDNITCTTNTHLFVYIFIWLINSERLIDWCLTEVYQKRSVLKMQVSMLVWWLDCVVVKKHGQFGDNRRWVLVMCRRESV